MVGTVGLNGLRPHPERAGRVTSPPYDVIKPGTALESRLRDDAASLYHVILGDAPADALGRLEREGHLVADDEPSYYVYEQRWTDGQGTPQSRFGVLVAAEVHPYEAGQFIRHEKTFDEKVKGRIALREATGYTFGPVFALVRTSLREHLKEACSGAPLYEFTSDFGGLNDLDGIHNRVWRVPEASDAGRALQRKLADYPFYIADGHHRYHASLKYGQTHCLCYVTDDAGIQAYNRVVNGVRPFSEIKDQLDLHPSDRFQTPPKHQFCLYSREGCWVLPAQNVPEDVVGRLDCAILERELYPRLGLTHDMIKDPKHFDYYPEWALDDMKAVVDRGDYDLAIALHPVSTEELVAVADANLHDPEVVMPEKSTFFAPKILSGLFIYQHTRRS